MKLHEQWIKWHLEIEFQVSLNGLDPTAICTWKPCILSVVVPSLCIIHCWQWCGVTLTVAACQACQGPAYEVLTFHWRLSERKEQKQMLDTANCTALFCLLYLFAILMSQCSVSGFSLIISDWLKLLSILKLSLCLFFILLQFNYGCTYLPEPGTSHIPASSW